MAVRFNSEGANTVANNRVVLEVRLYYCTTAVLLNC